MEPSRKLNKIAILIAVLLFVFSCATPTPPPPLPTPVPTSSPTAVPTSTPTATIPTVYFGPASSVLLKSDASVLDTAVNYMSSHSAATVSVNGYTSTIGTEAEDAALANQRSQAVAEYLESRGIASNRIHTYGYGKSNFVTSNKTPQGRALNDRVELMFTP